MRRRINIGGALLALALLLFMAPSSDAGPQGCTTLDGLTAFAFEKLTISSTALPLTATVYAPSGVRPADMAVVAVETNAVRFRDDGVAPTASTGVPIAASGTWLICGAPNVAAIKFIRQTSDATIQVDYYRSGQ